MQFDDFARLADAAGLGAIDRGRGHWQIRLNAATLTVVNWWPESVRRAVYISEIGARFVGVDDAAIAVALARVAFEAIKHSTAPAKCQFSVESIGRRIIRRSMTADEALEDLREGGIV
jgi:hypothetical protein